MVDGEVVKIPHWLNVIKVNENFIRRPRASLSLSLYGIKICFLLRGVGDFS